MRSGIKAGETRLMNHSLFKDVRAMDDHYGDALFGRQDYEAP
jgi:hypothetical protein